MSDYWNKYKESKKKTFEGGIKELPSILNEEQKTKVFEAYTIYHQNETKKSVIQRKFYIDEFGGTIYTVQFPKRSAVQYGTASNPTQYPKNKEEKKGWHWWGIRIPLFENINNDDKVPIATMFMPLDWANKQEEGIKWEEEEEDTMVTLRGNASSQYQWLNDTENPRFDNQFIKEAREKFDDNSIKSINDILQNTIYKSSMGYIKITLNPNQIIRVI